MIPRVFVIVSTLCWSVAAGQAAVVRPLPLQSEAAVVLSSTARAADVPPVVRCRRGQRVGVWLEGPQRQDLPPLRVDGCEIGILVDDPPDADVAVAVEQAVAPTVQGVTVRNCLYGIGVVGGPSTVLNNLVEGCDYGIVVYTDRHIIQGNQMRNVRYDGLLVVGYLNSLVGNRVTGAGRYGLALLGQAPMIAPGITLGILRRGGRQNSVRDNVISGSGSMDLYQWPVSCTNLGNTYVANTAATRSAPCMQ